MSRDRKSAWEGCSEPEKAYWACSHFGFGLLTNAGASLLAPIRNYCKPEIIQKAIDFVLSQLPEGIMHPEYPRQCAYAILWVASETGHASRKSYAEALSLPSAALGRDHAAWFRVNAVPKNAELLGESLKDLSEQLSERV